MSCLESGHLQNPVNNWRSQKDSTNYSRFTRTLSKCPVTSLGSVFAEGISSLKMESRAFRLAPLIVSLSFPLQRFPKPSRCSPLPTMNAFRVYCPCPMLVTFNTSSLSTGYKTLTISGSLVYNFNLRKSLRLLTFPRFTIRSAAVRGFP